MHFQGEMVLFFSSKTRHWEARVLIGPIENLLFLPGVMERGEGGGCLLLGDGCTFTGVVIVRLGVPCTMNNKYYRL